MAKCPWCGYEGEHVLIGTWKYSFWNVFYYRCSQCGSSFRYQVDPSGKRRSYVMRVGGRGRFARGS